MQILFVLIFWLIGLWILHWIISSAIDNSKLAKELKEIKELLKTQKVNDLQKQTIERNTNNMSIMEECLGCGELVHITDKECISCGLILINESK